MNIFGYFNDLSDTPAFDPGLDVPCPICGKPLHTAPRKTISLWGEESVSHFYRVHKACYEGCEPEYITLVESVLIDNLNK